MRKLTHLQTLHLLDADRQNISADDQASLMAHLETCVECRAYADDKAALGPQLTQLFHERWDVRRPQANVVAAVRPATQRRAWKRLGLELTWGVLGILAVFALMGMFRFFLPRPAAQPVATQTSTPVVQATSTLTAAPVQRPTATITPTPDDLATQAAQETENGPTNTPSAEDIAFRATQAAMVAYITAAVQPEIREQYASPDGNWQAQFIHFECTSQNGEGNAFSYEQIKLVDVRDGTERIAADQLLYCQGLGAGGLGGLFWSPNSRYFYYTTTRAGGPDGCGYWQPDINRVDVSTGEVERIGNGPVSPDGTKLAVWSHIGRDTELAVWDVDLGEIGRVQPDETLQVAGPVVWSPDSQALIYLLSDNICVAGKSQLTRLDLPDLRSSPLPAFDGAVFADVVWEKPGELLLSDTTGQSWAYDFATQGYEKRNSDGYLTPSPTVRITLPNEQITEVIPSIWNYYNLAEQLKLKQPGSLEFMVDVTNDWNLIWPFYWCAADSDLLAENLPALTVIFRVDGVEISKENLLEYDRSSEGWACHYWATMVSGWPRGQKVDLEIAYHLNRELNDGYAIYPAGDYRYRVTANVVIP
jgi:hypothetical protein